MTSGRTLPHRHADAVRAVGVHEPAHDGPAQHAALHRGPAVAGRGDQRAPLRRHGGVLRRMVDPARDARHGGAHGRLGVAQRRGQRPVDLPAGDVAPHVAEDRALAAELVGLGEGAVDVHAHLRRGRVEAGPLAPRDALRDNGRIVVSTTERELKPGHNRRAAEVPAGRYVVLTIADNGTGMDVETQHHLLRAVLHDEAEGKGTGLGLALVYGVVQQRGGISRSAAKCSVGSTFEGAAPRGERARDGAGARGHPAAIGPRQRKRAARGRGRRRAQNGRWHSHRRRLSRNRREIVWRRAARTGAAPAVPAFHRLARGRRRTVCARLLEDLPPSASSARGSVTSSCRSPGWRRSGRR